MALLGTYELADELFPDRIQLYRLELPDTQCIEEATHEHLVQADFPLNASLRFLRQVCRWGGYYGIAKRVRKNNNNTETIRDTFQTAHAQISARSPVDAINTVIGLNHLNFAFGSKFLRFLAPQDAAVLDSIISGETNIPQTPQGYGQLIEDCRTAAEGLYDAGIVNPIRPNGVWYVADIEAAFYADMRNYDA